MNDVPPELLTRLRQGDEAALGELMVLCRPMLMNIALHHLHSYEDAEEIVSKTFENAWSRIGQFRGDSKLETWLTRITVNLALNRWWYWKRRRKDETMAIDRPIVDGMPDTFHDLLPADALSVPRELELSETRAAIEAVIPELTPRHRVVLEMRLDGRSYEEIAAQLGQNIGTIKSRLARARESLRELLRDRCPTLVDVQPERAA